jgi:NTP pyrophosphatase (non-canonical NTP hydrolase)
MNLIIEGFNAAMTEAGITARANGFTETDVGTKLMLMVSELAEALEEYRGGHPVDELYYTESGKPEGVPMELADCIIRILSFADAHAINIGWAVKLKMEYNKTRPHKHGGKLF